MARPLLIVTPVVLLVLCPIPQANAQGTKTWVNQQVTKLTNPDKMVRKAARDALVDEAKRPASPPTYLKDLNAALIPLARGRNFPAAITAGVVAEEVAGQKPSPALEGVAQALMANGSDAIALAGVKVARALVPTTITLAKDPLADSVVSCVKAHPESGEIAEEAYAALTLQAGRKNGAPPPAATTAALPVVLNLLEARIASYGEQAPPKPGADGAVAVFLAIDASSAVLSGAPTTDRTLRDLGDLLCVQSRAVANGNSDRALNETRRQVGQALQVIAQGAQVTSPALESAIDALTKPLDGAGAAAPLCAALNTAMPAGAKLTRAKR